MIETFSGNNPNTNIDSNSSQITQPLSNSIFKSKNQAPLNEIDQKINQLTQIVESVSLQNQRLRPMLKSVADMQLFTFKKLKSYEASLEELKSKLNNSQSQIISNIPKATNSKSNNLKDNHLNNFQMNFRFVEP